MGISMKTTSGKILASVALVGTAAAVAGMGTFGQFTGSTNASQEVESGTVVIELGGAMNTLSDSITGLLPGDSVEKFATLSNTGDSDFSTVRLTTKLPVGATPNALTTDANGLKLTIESCTTAWTVVAGQADTCAGFKTVLTQSAILGTDRDLADLASVTAGSSDYLKITTSLPASAADTLQGLTSTIGFTFDATQRTGQVK